MVVEPRLAFMGIALWVGLCVLVMVGGQLELGVLGIVVLLAVADVVTASGTRHRADGRRSSSTTVV
jgi:hypothetical protein